MITLVFCRIPYSMKICKTVLCVILVLFLLFTPKYLVLGAKQQFVDTRFVRDENRYRGIVTMYHIVRHRPYLGSLTSWLQKRADEYEKKHRGSSIAVEGMSEETFAERMAHGRRADAYSFFSGSLYPDLLKSFETETCDLREGLFCTGRCVPYCYTGYVKLERNPTDSAQKTYYANDVLAAYLGGAADTAEERKADTLYLDLRRAGDLMRYQDGFASAQLDAIDNFTDAVCWIGIDRDTDAQKTEVLRSFIQWLLSESAQEKLSALGLFSVRTDIRNTATEAILKPVCKVYQTVRTVDPFLWYEQYDALAQDARNARNGDAEALARFQKRFEELRR